MVAPSAMAANGSSTGRHSLVTFIKALGQGRETDSPVGIEETLTLVAPLQIGVDHAFDGTDHPVAREGGADDLAQARILGAAAAEGDLVELLAFLVDAEDADMADMVVTASIDA